MSAGSPLILWGVCCPRRESPATSGGCDYDGLLLSVVVSVRVRVSAFGAAAVRQGPGSPLPHGFHLTQGSPTRGRPNADPTTTCACSSKPLAASTMRARPSSRPCWKPCSCAKKHAAGPTSPAERTRHADPVNFPNLPPMTCGLALSRQTAKRQHRPFATRRSRPSFEDRDGRAAAVSYRMAHLAPRRSPTGQDFRLQPARVVARRVAPNEQSGGAQWTG